MKAIEITKENFLKDNPVYARLLQDDEIEDSDVYKTWAEGIRLRNNLVEHDNKRYEEIRKNAGVDPVL